MPWKLLPAVLVALCIAGAYIGCDDDDDRRRSARSSSSSASTSGVDEVADALASPNDANNANAANDGARRAPADAPAAGAPAGNAPSTDTRDTRAPSGSTRTGSAGSENQPQPRDEAQGNAGDDAPANRGDSTQVLFREHHVRDSGMNNQTALTVLVPEGWKVEGGLFRPAPQAFRNPALVDVTITAPDGRSARLMPTFSFEFGAGRGGQLMQITQNGNFYFPIPETLADFIREMSQVAGDENVANLRFVSEEPMPALTRQLREQFAGTIRMTEQMNRQNAAWGVQMQFDAKVTKLVFQYRENGKQMEETLVAAWSYGLNLTNGQVTGGYWGIVGMASLGGPVGTDYNNDPVLHAIMSTVRYDPKWQAEMTRYWQKLSRIVHEGNMERLEQNAAAARKRAETASKTSDMMHQAWLRDQERDDARHEREIDLILDRTVMTTPSGAKMKVPSLFDKVFTDGNGNVVMTNDPGRDPNNDPRHNNRQWQQMQPVVE